MEIRQYLAHHMPELNALIVVENYPAAEVYVILAGLANFAMMFVCGLLFFGDAILGALGIQQVPAFLEVVRENKMKTVMFMFLVNSFAQKLTATGAFEISYNNDLIFSKLESGMVPSGPLVERTLRTLLKP